MFKQILEDQIAAKTRDFFAGCIDNFELCKQQISQILKVHMTKLKTNKVTFVEKKERGYQYLELYVDYGPNLREVIK